MSRYYSTRDSKRFFSLKDALFQGLSQDGGLYMPEIIPRLPDTFFEALPNKKLTSIAFELAKHLLKDDIPNTVLEKIVNDSFSFDAPLHHLESHVYALELFHGPTLSFKDFGARFMARLLGHFLEEREKPLTVLVATSGDTGSAVAQGFYNVPGINVCILYPSGKISKIQEKQMTTLGKNIKAIEVEGTFDDCQQLVKQVFSDKALRENINITSANSINIGRLIPQIFYYFYAYAQLGITQTPVYFSVPSGNFGNLTAGLIAKRMGLPVKRFVASTNINDVIPEYLKTAVFTPRKSKATLSNAMDVGNPSNFDRIQDLYKGDVEAIRRDIVGAVFTDEETLHAIRNVYTRTNYLLDPHGAVAYLGLKKNLNDHENIPGVFLETAHPAKFKNIVEACLGCEISCPKSLKECLKKDKQAILIKNSYEELISNLY